MPPSQMLADLRERAIKVNEEIAELKFGCILEMKTNPNTRGFFLGSLHGVSRVANMETGYVWEYKALGKRIITVVGVYEPSEMGKYGLSDWKIIGRPIQLADILFLFEKMELKEIIRDSENINCGEEADAVQYYQHGLLNIWHLPLPLEKQPEETIKWIWEVTTPPQ